MVSSRARSALRDAVGGIAAQRCAGQSGIGNAVALQVEAAARQNRARVSGYRVAARLQKIDGLNESH